MYIKTIITKRLLQKWRSWQLVYEWEDVFKEHLDASLFIDLDKEVKRRRKFVFEHLPIAILWKFRPAFVFYMLPDQRVNQHNNSPYVIPCIIDWYLKTEEELNAFFKQFSKHRLILVTSMQVYQYLKNIDTPIPIGHLPLSLSDKYRITPETTFKKDLDIVLMGRQNPVLLGWLNEYSLSHPNLTIAQSKREKDNYNYYLQDGTFVTNATTREQYMSLMRRSKISLYSTKGMDSDYTDYNTNGFNQVTPRIFEHLATGNHVIARYKKNEDTDFFELEKICPHTDSYESFKKQMDFALTNPVNMGFYSDYLENHYTSTRVNLLEELVKPL